MVTRLIAPFATLLVLAGAPLSAALSPAEQAGSTRETRVLLIGFEDTVETCVATAFRNRSWTAGEVDIQSLLEGLGVVRVEPVFRSPAQQEALERGRHRIPLAELREHHRARAVAGLAKRGLDARGLVSAPGLHHVYRVELGPDSEPRAALSALARHPRVAFAEPNRLYATDALPGDPHVDPDGDGHWQEGSWGQGYADLWGLQASGWQAVWEERGTLWSDPARIGGAGVVVAVVDTGVDYDHPDLAANVWRDPEGNPGADFVDAEVAALTGAGWVLDPEEDYEAPDSDPQDRSGHGTLVAGVIAARADNGEGIAGVAWGARVMPARAGFVVRHPESGQPVGLLESDDVAAAIVWAAEAGAHVLNLSFGSDEASFAISAALDHAFGLGVLAVAAAGNNGSDAAHYPASTLGVLAVAALDPGGDRAPFSNWGRSLELAAPGVDILSLKAASGALGGPGDQVGEHYLRATGTSFAAPHVAGAAALLISAFPGDDAVEITARLTAASDPLPASIPGSDTRYALAGGRLQLRSCFSVSPGPHAVLRGLSVDFATAAGSNADGLVEPGETVPLLLEVENVWREVGRVEARLVADDPFVVVRQANDALPSFLPNEYRNVFFLVQARPEVPPRHQARLRLELRAPGFSQDLSFSLRLHEPIPFAIALDAADFGDANFSPRVASDAAGSFVAVWSRRLFGENETHLEARLFNAQGEPLGERFRIDPGTAEPVGMAEVARAPHGPFAVVWRRYVAAPVAQHLIEGRVFDAHGAPAGPVFRVNPETSDSQQFPRVAMDGAGRLAVVWEAFPSAPESRVFLRRFGPQGQPLGGAVEVNVVPGYHSDADLAFGTDGSLLVVWRYFEGQGLIHSLARRFDPQGNPAGTVFQLDQEPGRFNLSPAVAASPRGGFAAVWENCEGPGAPCTLRGRMLDAQGEPLGPELQVSPDDRREIVEIAVAADSRGRIAAAWSDCAPGGFFLTGCRAHFQALSPDGALLGEPFSYVRPDETLELSLAAAPGGFTLAWEEYNHPPDGIFGAHLEVFSPTEPCDPADSASLCLGDGRFRLGMTWRTPQGTAGSGTAVPLTADSGAFWFFRPDNVEVIAKVLDGSAVNGHFWVFYGALSNVEYTLTVTDTETGDERTYVNPAGQLASRADTTAFPAAPAGATGSAATAGAGSGTPLLLLGDRFRAEVAWRTPAGASGTGVGSALGDRTGTFWFFRADNVELVVKVLDGRPVNGRFWVFYGALSNVEYTLTVTDTQTGAQRQYHNPPGNLASVADTAAFPP